MGLTVVGLTFVPSSNGMVGFGYSYPLRTHSFVLGFNFVPTGQVLTGLGVVGRVGRGVRYVHIPLGDKTCPGPQLG